MKHSYPWLAVMIILCAGTAKPVHAAIEYAEVTGGRVQGEVHDGLASFKGLSFASPPLGALRWRVPQPVVAWSGVRKVDTFAPACIQPWADNPNPNQLSEDCLYLNVWTAAVTAKERRPVMVWIHGGGLTNGMSWETLSHGTKLAPEGVVLVTIAYRLGAFGFLAHPELTRESGKGSGNYGLFDAVAALKWVQANIAQFGGDPSRVTIFGGSSGALMVSLLAGAPAAKGLYARAIAQGGSGFHPNRRYPRYIAPLPPLRDAEATGADFFKLLGVPNLKSARHLSAEAILKATDSAAPGFRPTVDGDLLIGSSVELFQQGRFNDTPILVGFTSDELGADPPKILADWLESVIERSRCTDTQAAIAAAYPPTRDAPTNTPTNMNRYLFRDFYVGWPAWDWARLQSTKGHNPAYVYFFDVHDREHPFGAPHATEYPFVFGNFPKPPSADDEATSALMRQYWINFAAHGDPNGPGLPVWKAFDEDSLSAMVFDDSSGSRRLPNIDGLKLLDALQRCGNNSSSAAAAPRSIAELAPSATIKLGETADWVAITADAVWVASTGPFAVNRIDPKTNTLAASVRLAGEPCAGLAIGAGSLWVPICTTPPSLAKVNLKTSQLVATYPVGAAAAEGGIAYGAGSVWLIVNKSGDLARIEPTGGKILSTYKVPAGSYNPRFSDGTIWVSHAEGADLTSIDAMTGKTATVATGPNPRFLTAGAGAIWTLNQGDGSVTRVDVRSGHASSIAVETPGHGGDIAFGAGRVWTTMPKMPLSVIDAAADKLICQWAGPGGDSLGIGHGAIWLTDYHAGSVSRIPVKDALAKCSGSPRVARDP